jgi:hypothetical protein
MFRRRPLRRRFTGPVPPRRRAALKRLQRAHQLMSEGSFKEAGRIFEELAEGAAKRRIPRAPQLFLQAGQAFIKAGEHPHGIELLRRGLHLMERMGQYRRLPAASQRVLAELEALGFTEEREALETEIQEMLSQHGISLSATSQQEKPRLPGKCPQCGGTVHPQEVEWIDERTASCDYCGSILEG